MLEIIKVLIPGLIAFSLGMALTPIILAKLYQYKLYRKKTSFKNVCLLDENNQISEIINKTKRDLNTPRMGGLVIIFAVLITTVIFWLISFGFFGNPSGKIDFLSRSQTWLPLAAFVAGSLIGLLDDYLTIRNLGKTKNGLQLSYRIIFVIFSALLASFWFFYKLGMDSVFIPFYGDFFLGILFIPFFIIVFLAVFATSNIDGLDGLAGGLMAIIYSAVGLIAFFQDKFNIAALSFVIVGALLAFLWSNVSPAKFYLGEVGYNALSFTLVIIAFVTNSVFLLPIIAIMLFINLNVTVLQVFSIRFLKKRFLKVAPLHHYFELLGWSEQQIVIRYWIVSIVFAIIGVVISITMF